MKMMKFEVDEMGSRGTGSGKIGGAKSSNPSVQQVIDEIQRQNSSLSIKDIETYVQGGLGAATTGFAISNFLDDLSPELKYSGDTLYRGLRFSNQAEYDNFMKNHQSGDIFKAQTQANLSWTSDFEVANKFAQYNTSHSVVVVSKNSSGLSGMSIKNIADTPVSSSEVLVSRKQKFKINTIKQKNNTTYIYTTPIH